MKAVAWLFGVATLLGAAVYTVVSLNRWEWNRALFFGLVLLVAEVGLGVALVLRKLGHIHDDLRAGAAGRDHDPATLRTLVATRPEHHRFEWLRDSVTRTNVFITMLVGGGVVVSALAWLLDKLGAATITPARERSLARELHAIAYPPDGLYVDEVEALAQSVPHYDDPKLRSLLRRH